MGGMARYTNTLTLVAFEIHPIDVFVYCQPEICVIVR